MKTILRTIMVAVGLVLLGIGVGAVVCLPQMEELGRKRLEDRLSNVFGSDAHVGGVGIEPLRSTIVIRDVVVDNPPPFRPEPAIRVGTIRVRLAPETLFAPALVVEEIRLRGTDLTLRWEAGRGTNLGALSEKASSYDPSGSSGRSTQVREFHSEEAVLKLKSNLVPIGSLPLNIASFKLDEFEEGRPLPPGKISAITLESLVMEAITLKGILRPAAELLKKEFTTEGE